VAFRNSRRLGSADSDPGPRTPDPGRTLASSAGTRSALTASEPVKRDDAISVLRANLAALPAETRRALEAAEDSAPVDLSSGFASASVKTPVGRWTRVHNSPSPVASAEALVAKVASGNPPLVIVIGLGLGYLLDALEERTSTRVLAVEPVPSLVRAMLSRRDWTPGGFSRMARRARR
jgi:hypothetical protein